MIIDYLSISFKHTSFEQHRYNLLSSDWAIMFGTASEGGGRAPYHKSYKFDGCTVFEGSGGLLYEFGGRGCRILYQYENVLMWFLNNGNPTRIDIAIDYKGVSLNHLVSDAVYSSHIKSSQGETFYFGSPKSDLFVRCYEYAPPHDRAGVPRIEFVFRRDYAVSLRDAIVSGENDSIIASLHKKARRHSIDLMTDYAIGSKNSLKLGHRMDRGLSGTQAWLKKQVAPAIKKLLDNGYTKEEVLQWLNI